jgi:ribonucleotide monophosphatase NagD (HAD superfamily)
MYELAMARMDAQRETTAAVGDRVATDTVGGKRAGVTTTRVISGASGRDEAEAAGADFISTTSRHSSTPGAPPWPMTVRTVRPEAERRCRLT